MSGLTSCMGRDGRDGLDAKLTSFNFHVEAKDWQFSNLRDNNYFYVVCPAPEITWDVYDNAVINIYREYLPGSSDAARVALPYLRMKEYNTMRPDPENPGQYLWAFYSESVDYEYTQGRITFFFTASDFEYELNEAILPEAMDFTIMITRTIR